MLSSIDQMTNYVIRNMNIRIKQDPRVKSKTKIETLMTIIFQLSFNPSTFLLISGFFWGQSVWPSKKTFLYSSQSFFIVFAQKCAKHLYKYIDPQTHKSRYTLAVVRCILGVSK